MIRILCYIIKDDSTSNPPEHCCIVDTITTSNFRNTRKTKKEMKKKNLLPNMLVVNVLIYKEIK